MLGPLFLRVPITQSHIAVCYCVRSLVSAGTNMYGVMSLYASKYAVLVLCVCSSHISICVQEFLFLSVVFMLLCSCVHIIYSSFLFVNIY